MPPPYSTGFDAHTHLDHPGFDPDREAVLARAREAGVGGVAIAGADPSRWDRLREVADGCGAVAVLGVHPWWVAELDDAGLDAALARLPDVLGPHGLGETGLDRVRSRQPEVLERQRYAFVAQLALARARDLPVVLHGARAWAEVVRICAREGLPARGGQCHAWTGAPEVAEHALDLGLMLSFGPDVRRSRRARATVPRVPRDRLLLETDAPDRPWTGDRGEPAHLVHVAAEVAALRGERVDEVLAYTGSNARRLFGVEEA